MHKKYRKTGKYPVQLKESNLSDHNERITWLENDRFKASRTRKGKTKDPR